MAHWDSAAGKIVGWETKELEERPGWYEIDCGCCVGIEWGGDYPRECRRCGGSGTIFWHKKSRVLADYPGGPLRGKM